MPSYFKSNATDLDDIFVPRSDTTLGTPTSPTNAFYSGSTVLEAKYVRYTELGLAEPGTPLVSATGFKYNTKDLHFVYVPPADVQKICSYLTSAGLAKYGYGNTLQVWGVDPFGTGVLGINDLSAAKSNPTQVGVDTNWNVCSVGAGSAYAVKTTGTLWAWGGNDVGELGINNRAGKSNPTQVGALTDWSSVANMNMAGGGSNKCCIAIKTTGSLWSWGGSGYGVSGRLEFISRSSPTQVGTLTNWKSVSMGNTCAVAVKTDGTLWAWGENGGGNLGVNDRISRSSPVQVGTLTTWASASCNSYDSEQYIDPYTLAIRTNGTLWAWGSNSYGRLGLNNTISRSSPVQVGALTNWASVRCGKKSSFATKTDGTLWAWGENGSNGLLGLNEAGIFSASRSSPVQVGSLTNWKSVSTGYVTVFATKTDNTMWAWGFNNSGVLGIGNTQSRSSPTQIGSSTYWSSVAGSYYNAFAVQKKTCS